MDSPALYGPAVTRVLLKIGRAACRDGPPFPVVSVSLARIEWLSAGVAVALLSNAPAARIVAVTLMVVCAPEASEAIVLGSAAQALAVALLLVSILGVSVTWMLVAVDGPAFATTSV